MTGEDHLTNSAKKRRFFQTLEEIELAEDTDIEDETILNAESFFRDPKPPSGKSSDAPLLKSSAGSDAQNVRERHEAIPDSGSETQSEVESRTVNNETVGCTNAGPRHTAVNDSSSETQSDPGSAVKLRRVHSLTVQSSRRRTASSTIPAVLKKSVSAPPVVKESIADQKRKKRSKAASSDNHYPQIFAGKKFFFVPNDDKNPARKLRMLRVRQHGGIRLPSWADDVDFLALEDRINYEELMRWVQTEYKIDGLPEHINVVNVKFIGDCFDFRSVLDYTQPCYRIAPSTSIQARDHRPVIKQSNSQTSSLPLTRQASKLLSKKRLASPPRLTKSLSAAPNSSTPKLNDDELMQAFHEARELQFISFTGSEDGFGRDESAGLASLPYKDTRDWQKNFSCMLTGSDALAAQNPNARTISILDQMSHYYDNMGDQFRSISYRKAVTALRKEHRPVVTKKDALSIRFIGQSIAEKIEEIALTERLKKLENLMDDDRGRVLQLFTKIYGVGMNQASKWVGLGYRTLDDLVSKAKLTDAQRIGIEHYEDFLERIPREEVEKHGDHVRECLRQIDQAFEVTIGGSYRRGKADSGDIDLIITKPGAQMHEIRSVVLDRLVSSLTEQGFLTVRLSGGRSDHGNKWHGCSVLPGTTIWRRIDFLMVPWDEMGAALIYFTGNDIFNRSIRLLASKKKMCLNQSGLYGNVLRKRNREKINHGDLLESKSERRIFELLGVPWRAPHERNL